MKALLRMGILTGLVDIETAPSTILIPISTESHRPFWIANPNIPEYSELTILEFGRGAEIKYEIYEYHFIGLHDRDKS